MLLISSTKPVGWAYAKQISISASVKLLRELGPMLGFPHSSGIEQSKHTHMRELRIQHRGNPLRILYAFDPSRSAILFLGGETVSDFTSHQI